LTEVCRLAIKQFVQTTHLLLTAEEKIFAGWCVSGGMQRTAGYGEQCGTTIGTGKRLLH